jgi:hypothetical protein
MRFAAECAHMMKIVRMRALLAVVAALGVLGPVPASAVDDPHAWVVRYMLINGSDDATLIGATSEVANHSRLRTAEAHELLAEVLAEISSGKMTAPQTAVDIVRILGAAPDGQRFHTTVRSVRRISERGMEQVQAAYTKRFPRAKGEQWVAGRIDLEALRKASADAAFAAKPTLEQAQALTNLPKKIGLGQLFATVGMPAHVRPRDTRAVKKYGSVDLRQMVVYYRGIGCVTLNYVDDIGWYVFSTDHEPLAYEDAMPYRRYAAAYGLPDDASLALTQLLSDDNAAIRMSAIAMHRLETPPPQYLDAAAEMLLRDHATVKGDERVDAYAWLCNVLAERGGIRYRHVLATVQKNATDLKLRKFAGQPVLNMKVPAPRYVAGSVALDELARKHPSPYADFAPTP